MLKKTTFSENPKFGLHEKFLIMVICKLKVDIFTSLKTEASTLRLKALNGALDNYLWFLLSEEFLFPKVSIQDNDVLNSSIHVKGMIAENRCILEKTLCW